VLVDSLSLASIKKGATRSKSPNVGRSGIEGDLDWLAWSTNVDVDVVFRVVVVNDVNLLSILQVQLTIKHTLSQFSLFKGNLIGRDMA